MGYLYLFILALCVSTDCRKIQLEIESTLVDFTISGQMDLKLILWQ